MLAQNFMTAEALGITDEQLAALIKTLGFFERGEVPVRGFAMQQRYSSMFEDCGTAVCLLGWHDVLHGEDSLADAHVFNGGLARLFLPNGVRGAINCRDPAKAAHALRNYLTTGDPRWEEVMAEPA